LQSFDEYNGKNVPVCQLLKDKRLEFEVDIECFKAVQQLFGFETYYIWLCSRLSEQRVVGNDKRGRYTKVW